MNLKDRLSTEQRKKDEIRRRQQQDAEEETLTYKPWQKRTDSLNDSASVFGSVFSGFNTQKSVFDETAVFRTKKEQDQK